MSVAILTFNPNRPKAKPQPAPVEAPDETTMLNVYRFLEPNRQREVVFVILDLFLEQFRSHKGGAR